MSPTNRRVCQALLYEIGAVAMVTPILTFAFDAEVSSTLPLSVLMATIALIWNYTFNALFERWERKQVTKGRSLQRRLVHGAGFEGGLVIVLVPLTAYWLDISLWQALLAEIGLLITFFLYAIVFTWAFDKVFGLPASAQEVKE
ncbi:PACE efflux transporter [uncultured Zhongshania sp.]|uniref:PACE efflux transporter n=1 Tax=uncultured Zhongshania sp. TaxID=1642288 RepID=UPI0030DBBF0D|tara:strand:+ start:376 stop:807 length:432 start_codon:yes stop_codon:yes gene_type:complete